ncbi:MAG TPA: sensor domain-containing diguanylate cyclase, partial [Bacillota bacterium]|nr:sensor domain-containing diguanylate cyclase [Bacillota bacterium]
HARLAGIAIILLRSVIVAACIMFGLHKLAIRPGLITTVIPAAALSVAIWMLGSRFNSRVVSVVASAFDMGFISVCVHFGGGLSSEAYALYFVALSIIALQESAISSSLGGIVCAALYGAATFPWSQEPAIPGWTLPYRCGVIMFAGGAIGLMSQASKECAARLASARDKLDRRAHWDQVLARVTRKINSGIGLRATLELILDGGLEVLGGDFGMVALKDRRGRLVASACRNSPPGLLGRVFRKDEGLVNVAVAQRQTVRVSDYASFSGAIPEVVAEGLSAVAATPLLSGPDCIGALTFGNRRSGAAYTPEDCEFLEMLGKQLSVVVGNAHLLDEVQRRADYLSTLNEISMSLTSVLERDALFEKIYREVCRIIPVDAFFVAIFHAGSREIEMAFLMDQGVRSPSTRFGMESGPTAKVITSGQPILFNRQEDEMMDGERRLGHNVDEVTASVIIVPMRVGAHVVGAVSAQSYTMNAYGEEERDLLMTIASSAAIALENARLYQSARELSLTDDLTGLGNYRYFCDLLDKEIERAIRHSTPLTLVMLDSDHLKYINDKYGHAIGDTHLIHLADTMRAVARKSDILARYAGDEFMIILPNTAGADGLVLAERLRAEMERTPLMVDGTPVTATISLGVASMPQSGGSVDALVRAADAAMYEAKRQGKNRVMEARCPA